MKRFFFSLLALSAAFVSCTQSAVLETPDLFGTEITFNPYTGRTPETKATQIADANALAAAGGFNVLGFLTRDNNTTLYMDKAVDLEGSEWTYDGLVYWPDDNGQSTLAFAAYSSNVYGADGTPNTGDDLISWQTQNKIFKYTVPASINKQVDLLATNYQTGLTLQNNKSSDITLNFNHLLSKVGFKLVANNNNEDIDIVIKSVVLEGTFPQSGNVDITSTAVAITQDDADGTALYQLLDIDNTTGVDGCFVTSSSTTEAEIYVSHVTPTSSEITESTEFTSHTSAAANKNNRYMMIMPHQVTAATADKITVVYQITESEEKTAEITLPTDLEFKPAYAYEFILKVSTSSINFTVEEYYWGDGAGDENPYPVVPDDNALKVTAASAETNRASATVEVAKGDYKTIGMQYQTDGGSWTDIGSTQTYNESTTSYTFSLTGLTPNQEYSLRAVAINSENEKTYSSGRTITTLPEVATAAATVTGTVASTNASATLNGTFASTNGTASVTLGFYYSINQDLTGSTTVTTDRAESFSKFIENLTPNTPYYFQAFATNNGGTATGETLSFTSPITLPAVTTDETISVGVNTATLNGTLVSNGGDTEITVGFIYGNSDTVTNGAISGTETSGTLSGQNISNLTRYTTYYVQAYATNTAGTTYGGIKEFKTQAETPIVTTNVTAYTATTASLSGTITDNGGAAITVTGFYYSTSNTVDADGKLSEDPVSGSVTTSPFTGTLSNLDENTTYYVQAYATNEGEETGYGPIVSFTTSESDDPIIDWVDGNGTGETIN